MLDNDHWDMAAKMVYRKMWWIHVMASINSHSQSCVMVVKTILVLLENLHGWKWVLACAPGPTMAERHKTEQGLHEEFYAFGPGCQITWSTLIALRLLLSFFYLSNKFHLSIQLFVVLYCPLRPFLCLCFFFSSCIGYYLSLPSRFLLSTNLLPYSSFYYSFPFFISIFPVVHPGLFLLSVSTPSIMFICLCLSSSCLSLAILSLAVPLLSYLLVYLCVCVCTDNSLAGSVHRYWRPLRATLFILSRSSSTTAQEEASQPATVCVNQRERERNEWKALLCVCVFVVHVCV